MLRFNQHEQQIFHGIYDIQIHLMLRFNSGSYYAAPPAILFKYISCYGLIDSNMGQITKLEIQIHLMLRFNEFPFHHAPK